MISYPTSFPIDAMIQAGNIIRQNQFVEQQAELGLAAWNLQGYLQSTLLIDPKTGLSSAAVQKNLETDKKIQEFLNTPEVVALSGHSASPHDKIGDGTIIKALWPYILQLLAMFLNKPQPTV